MNKELRSIKTLSNWSKNPRGIKTKDFDRLKKQIQKLGMYKPLLITEDGTVLGGNMRLRAYKELDITDVWVSVVEAETDDKKLEYALSDNDRAGYYEEDDLAELVLNSSIDTDLFHVDMGSPISVRELLQQLSPEEVVEDEAPQVQETAVSKLGEVYQLGRHRLMCGDATSIDNVATLMNGQKAAMSFTSPPYNVGHNIGYDNKESKYQNSDDNLDNYVDLIVKSTMISLEYSKEVFVNIQLLANNKKDILLWLAELSGSFKDIFFWRKRQVAPAMAANVANSQVEIIVLFGHNNNRAWGNQQWRGNFSNSIETASASGENKNSAVHNATFPVALPSTFIKQGYTEGSIILDLFGGTGTTIIACEQLNRICYTMELYPHYCDVMRKRYANFIGQGEKWEEITPIVTDK